MNYSDKLERLRDRRQGLYKKDGTYNVIEALASTRTLEKFASIAEPEPIKYALGSMQRVDAEYTQKTYAEGTGCASVLQRDYRLPTFRPGSNIKDLFR